VGSDAELDGVLAQGTQPSSFDQRFGRGVTAQYLPDTGSRSKISLLSCVIEDNHDVGLYLGASDATVQATLIRGTKPGSADGTAGDGLAAAWAAGGVKAEISGSRFEKNARAGVSGFGAEVTLEASAFDCNGFDLDGEVEQDQPPSFLDEGGNRCGCGADELACQVRTQHIAPPEPHLSIP